MGNELDEENSQVKDVYAHFGLAMYLAQCLEHGIVNALLVAKLLPNELIQARTAGSISLPDFEQRFDVFMDEHFKMTMGGLISRLRTATALSPTFEAECLKAKDMRNFLAHHFFRERSEEFISKVGRTGMLAELEEAQRLFERVDENLTAAARRLAPTAGVNLTKHEQRTADYMATVYARASALDALADANSEESRDL